MSLRLKNLVFCIILLLFFQSLYAEKIDVYKRPLQSERSRDYDVLHYKIKLRFNEDKKTFWGENTITLSPLKDNFSCCVLDAETFTVTAVKDINNRPMQFSQPPHKLVVLFPAPYGYGEKVTFTVEYVAKNVKADPVKFGMSKNYAIGLTFVDQSPANPRLIQALSFPTGARHWFPCYDHPNDKATQEIIATVKEKYKVLSNGKLISVSTEKVSNTKTYHWLQELPHPTYLSMLVAGPYHIIEDSLGNLKINYWVYQKDLKHARRSFRKTPEIIKFFNKEFGYEYPWNKYDQIIVPGIGGGAECTSATLIGQATIHDEKAEKDFPSHGLIAHEAAHQWWGDLVTLRDWGHTWINESFGTYFDYIFTKHDLGEDEGAVNLLRKKRAYLKEAKNSYMRPVVFHRWNYPAENFDRHTYPKGAAVIHMMRWILGEKPFLKTISHFLHKHAFQPADTHDFLTAVKEVTGQNLDWFFQQWLLKPGHPVFKLVTTWEPDKKNIQVKVSQIQDTSKDIPVFTTPVVFKIVTPAGNQLKRVWIRSREEVFNFPCSQRPSMVRFDEGNYLLKEWTYQKPVEELLYQLKFDDVIGRSWAALELSRFKNNSRVEKALKTSASNDIFWFVRRNAVLSLGKLQLKKFIPFFKKKTGDKNSKVRTVALAQLGETKLKSLTSFFMKRFKGETSYLAQAEALRAIGKCGDRSNLKFLEEAGKIHSPRNILARAAKWAQNKLGQN